MRTLLGSQVHFRIKEGGEWRTTSGYIIDIRGEHAIIKCENNSLYNRPISKLKTPFNERLSKKLLSTAQEL